MNTALTLKITGEIPTKKNNYRIGRDGRLHTGLQTRSWNEDALWQLKDIFLKGKLKKPIPGPLILDVEFYITKDKDIDNMLNSLFDVLQTGNVIENDREVRTIQAQKFKVKNDPYVAVKIFKVL